jgi:hypothetical protein
MTVDCMQNAENLKARDHLGRRGIDVKIILKWILVKEGVMLWNGKNWLRIHTNDEIL